MTPERPKTRSGRRASQSAYELAAFIDLLRKEGVRSYLEIGARHGDTFYEVMRALPVGSKGSAMDLPGGLWGTPASRVALNDTVNALRADGYQTYAIFGDSKSAAIRQMAMAGGPYDAALIDGDHLYDGVKTDWLNYGPMARLVAFHDIVGDGQAEKVHGNPVEVPRLWAELKATHRHVEFIAPDSTMGIGVLWRG